MSDDLPAGSGQEADPTLLSPQEALLLRLVRDGWTVDEMAAHVDRPPAFVRATLRALAHRLRRF
ncbi:MAG TPA: hypothetical protein VN697_10950 [Tepidiformaceae bacterium]|nr:hypothetical protein [Tepidiformaceae bacterium]